MMNMLTNPPTIDLPNLLAAQVVLPRSCPSQRPSLQSYGAAHCHRWSVSMGMSMAPPWPQVATALTVDSLGGVST